MLGERERDVGRPVVDRAPLALDEAEGVAGVEALLEHDAAAVGHHRQECVLAPEAPEERDAHPQPIALVQVLPLADVEHVLDQAGVGERDALRGRGGPRGVEDVRDVGRLHRHLPGVDLAVGDSRSQLREVAERGQAAVALRGQAHEVPEHGEAPGAGADLGQHGEIVLAQEAVDRDQRGGVGVAQQVVELPRARPRADGHQRGAQHGHREVGEEPLEAIA